MNSLKSCLFILISFLAVVFLPRKNITKKVVFIIVDGIAEDMLDKAEIPSLNRIKKTVLC